MGQRGKTSGRGRSARPPPGPPRDAGAGASAENARRIGESARHLGSELAKIGDRNLKAFRDKDRTYLRDLIDVGLIDATWPARFPGELQKRLQSILDKPEG